MTIKEMCKVFKKLEKLEDEFSAVKLNLMGISVYGNMDFINENAKKLAKITSAISKIAAAMGVETDALMERVTNEEDFCRWCLICNIDMNAEEAEEADEPAE